MKKTLTTLGLAASLAIASPVYAQDQQAKDQQAKDQKGPRTVVGEVVDTRDIQLTGVNAQHRLLKVETKQGKNVVVNIGDATKTPQEDQVKKGDKIVAVGKAARINGKPIIFAKYVGEMTPAGHVGGSSKQGQ